MMRMIVAKTTFSRRSHRFFPTPRIAMSGEDTIKPEGEPVRLAGAIEADAGFAGEPSSATPELIDSVTEATWKEALRQLGGLPSNTLPLWTILASRILARGRRWGARSATAQAFRVGCPQRIRLVWQRSLTCGKRPFRWSHQLRRGFARQHPARHSMKPYAAFSDLQTAAL